MTDNGDSLLIDVRAGTSGFAQDIAAMRKQIDSDLVGGFTRAGDTLERGLASAIRQGGLGFDTLKDVALRTLGDIAASAAQSLIAPGAQGGTGSSSVSGLGNLVTSALGLPGRATGGNVAPGAGYLVGERGPELFVPTSAGRVEAVPGGATGPATGRAVNVAITVSSPRGSSVPPSLQRSSRQVASAVRRALSGN